MLGNSVSTSRLLPVKESPTPCVPPWRELTGTHICDSRNVPTTSGPTLKHGVRLETR